MSEMESLAQDLERAIARWSYRSIEARRRGAMADAEHYSGIAEGLRMAKRAIRFPETLQSEAGAR